MTIFDLQTPDYMRQLEMCIQLGRPCLCQNLKEELDPSLNPVLNKAVKKMGNFKKFKKFLKILNLKKYINLRWFLVS